MGNEMHACQAKTMCVGMNSFNCAYRLSRVWIKRSFSRNFLFNNVFSWGHPVLMSHCLRRAQRLVLRNAVILGRVTTVSVQFREEAKSRVMQ